MPGSELVVFPGAGHFPQLDDPQRFVEVLTEFIDTTVPADVDGSEWGDLLRAGAPGQPCPGARCPARRAHRTAEIRSHRASLVL